MFIEVIPQAYDAANRLLGLDVLPWHFVIVSEVYNIIFTYIEVAVKKVSQALLRADVEICQKNITKRVQLNGQNWQVKTSPPAI